MIIFHKIFVIKVYLVAGGWSSASGYLDSSEKFVEGQSSWEKVAGLTLPDKRRGPFMINLNNHVFLSGAS